MRLSLSLLAFVALAGSAAAQTSREMVQVTLVPNDTVAVYRGPIVYPDFAGRDKKYAMFRTRIREGMKEGVKFAGKYAVIEFGCGTHCKVSLLADVSTGRVMALPRGGEESYYNDLGMRPNSRFARTKWDDGDRCFTEDLIMQPNGVIKASNKRDIGEEKACW